MPKKDWDAARKISDEARKLCGSSSRASDNEVACDLIVVGAKKLNQSIVELKEVS